MSKKTRKDKEAAKLRREVEALRAQLKTEPKYQGVTVSRKEKKPMAKPQAQNITEPPLVVDVRPDLKKTTILTAVCLGIFLVLFLTQSRWPPILK